MILTPGALWELPYPRYIGIYRHKGYGLFLAVLAINEVSILVFFSFFVKKGYGFGLLS